MGAEIKPARCAASDACPTSTAISSPSWRWAAAAQALAAAWRAHVQQEEAQQIPAAQPAAAAQGVDLMAPGAVIAQRRGELLGDQGVMVGSNPALTAGCVENRHHRQREETTR